MRYCPTDALTHTRFETQTKSSLLFICFSLCRLEFIIFLFPSVACIVRAMHQERQFFVHFAMGFIESRENEGIAHLVLRLFHCMQSSNSINKPRVLSFVNISFVRCCPGRYPISRGQEMCMRAATTSIAKTAKRNENV